MGTAQRCASSTAQRWDSLLTPDRLSPFWRERLSLIPGYDAVASAVGCRFNAVAAEAAVNFFPKYLRHVEGDLAGQPFELQPWQQSVIANLFGWKRMDGLGRIVRRYREAFVYVPRGNGKTAFAAGLCLLVLFCDGEHGAQIYSAAAEREQAALLYRHAKGMVEQERQLSDRCKVYGGIGQRSIVLLDDEASSYKVLSADAFSKHGFNTHMAVVDELHAHPSGELVDVLKTSMGKQGRKQPLMVYITTADYHRQSICNTKYEQACKVRDGIIADPAFLPVVYEAAQDDDWTSPAVWKKANPNLGVSVSLDYLERECKLAQETPAYENTFRRLHLNQRTETDVRAIPMEKWDAVTAAVDAAGLAGRECWAGLDLSTTTDLSALVLAFPDAAGGYDVLPFVWVPRENARQRERRDRVPYEAWIRQGHMKATDGDVIDYDVIREDINELGRRFNIREIAADRWNATQIINQLQGDGFTVVAYGQGFRDMTAPTKELLKLVAAGQLRHGGHPVLRWNASNMATETDAAGNLKPSKKKSTERIDLMVATVMALGRAMVRDEADTWYRPGILSN